MNRSCHSEIITYSLPQLIKCKTTKDEISLFLELPEKNEENLNVEQISLFRTNDYEKLPKLSEFKNRVIGLKSVNSRVLNSSEYLY